MPADTTLAGMIHHVQVVCPVGGETAQRAFYADALGWNDFRPARKAHPAFVVDVDATAARLAGAGYRVDWADETEIPGRRRFHSFDGAGNRVEFLEG
jgi:hypothetical protein